jgi:ParB-like nuclease family protein
MSSRVPKALGLNPDRQFRRLKIGRICLDFQPRENLIDERVAEYEEDMRRRAKIDPVTVCYDGEDYLLKDGFHRVEAALRLGRKTILVKVTPGTRSEMEIEWQKLLAAVRADLANPAKPIG